MLLADEPFTPDSKPRGLSDLKRRGLDVPTARARKARGLGLKAQPGRCVPFVANGRLGIAPLVKNVCFEVHWYHCFENEWHGRTFAQHLRAVQEHVQDLRCYPLVVGEWSLALGCGVQPGLLSTIEMQATFAHAQLSAYREASHGWFFWTWRDSHGIEWDWQRSSHHGLLPPAATLRVGLPELPPLAAAPVRRSPSPTTEAGAGMESTTATGSRTQGGPLGAEIQSNRAGGALVAPDAASTNEALSMSSVGLPVAAAQLSACSLDAAASPRVLATAASRACLSPTCRIAAEPASGVASTPSTASAAVVALVAATPSSPGARRRCSPQGELFSEDEDPLEAIFDVPAYDPLVRLGDTVYLRTFHGRYMDVEGQHVRARYGDRGLWQQFVICPFVGTLVGAGRRRSSCGESGRDRTPSGPLRKVTSGAQNMGQRPSEDRPLRDGDVVSLQARHTNRFLGVAGHTVQACWEAADALACAFVLRTCGGLRRGGALQSCTARGRPFGDNAAAVQAPTQQGIDSTPDFTVRHRTPLFLQSCVTGGVLAPNESEPAARDMVLARWTDFGEWQRITVEKPRCAAVTPRRPRRRSSFPGSRCVGAAAQPRSQLKRRRSSETPAAAPTAKRQCHN